MKNPGGFPAKRVFLLSSFNFAVFAAAPVSAVPTAPIPPNHAERLDHAERLSAPTSAAGDTSCCKPDGECVPGLVGDDCVEAGGFPGTVDCGSETCDAFEHENVELISYLSYADFGSDPPGADIWGYVSPSGREYAIMGLRAAVAFIEVTDPENPQIIAQIPGPTSTWRDMKTHGHYCYVVIDIFGDGMQIIDMSQIDDGIVTLAATTHLDGTFFSSHNIAYNPSSGYAYLSGADINGGATALDLTNPLDPQIAGMWTEHYLHDVLVVTYETGVYADKEIAFGFGSSGGVYVIDFTDKFAPVTLDNATYPGLSYCHQGWVSEDLRYLFVNDELDESGGDVATTTTYVFDIQDLEDVSLVATFTSGSTSTDHNLLVKGNFVYEGNYQSGLRIFDISDPLNAEQVGFFDTYPENDNPGFGGMWAPYPFLPSGIVVCSDRTRGFYIFDVSEAVGEPEIPTLSQWGLVALTLLFLSAGTVIFRRLQTFASE